MSLARRSLLIALLAPTALAGEVQVRPNGDRIDVIATSAPLQEVLTRLSQQTGMKVVYDGTPPRALVTVSLVQRTPAEAVLALFEGLGLNYALAMDRTGTRVDLLILTAPSAGGAAPLRSGTAPVTPPTPDPRRGPTRPQPPPDDEREEEQQDENGRPQAAPTPPGPVIFQGPVPGPGRPGSPFGGQIGPLTLPTPPLPNVPTPAPTPTPSANIDLS